MPEQQVEIVDPNLLVRNIVGSAFPELGGIHIKARIADTENSFTGHKYVDGKYYVRLGRELEDAPIPVKGGAIAVELQKIANKVRRPKRYRGQLFLENLSKRFATRVSKNENIDLIERKLGGIYAEYIRFITDNCGYERKPIDGIELAELDIMNTAYHNFQDMRDCYRAISKARKATPPNHQSVSYY